MNRKEYEEQIEQVKEKIIKELENTKGVLVFGNERVAATCGSADLVMSKLASMIMQISAQTGIKEKEILKTLKEIIKTYKRVYE